MANPKKLLASAAIAAGLLGGGVAGLIIGVPGVSGAQTTTTPDAPPTTQAPGSNQTNPDGPAHDGNCPHMGDRARGDGGGGTPGQAPTTGGTNNNISFHHGGGLRL